MFGINGVFYRWHFYWLLKGVQFWDFDDFENNFVGSIAIFSQVDFPGFQPAVQQWFDLEKDVVLDIESLVEFYNVAMSISRELPSE